MFFLANIFSWFSGELSLKHIEALMGIWGYPLLFALLFSCGLGMPLPEDIPLILGGYFVATGKMHLGIAAISAWCGIVGGDCVLYTFGRRYGLGVSRIPVIGKHVTPGRIKWVEQRFQRYGIWMVGVGRMFAGVRGAMVLTAGTIRFKFIPFIIADGLAAIVSGGSFMALGYWAGRELGDLESLREKIQHYEHRVLFGLIILALLIVLGVWLKKRFFPLAHDSVIPPASATSHEPVLPSVPAAVGEPIISPDPSASAEPVGSQTVL